MLGPTAVAVVAARPIFEGFGRTIAFGLLALLKPVGAGERCLMAVEAEILQHQHVMFPFSFLA